MADVFISYHTSSAKEEVEQIANLLESNGISCWYALRDCAGSFAGSIAEAIDGCRIFLFVLNQGFSASRDCLSEARIAFDRYSRHENILLLPFRVEQCQLDKDLWYFLGQFHIMDGSAPPETSRIQELDQIARMLEDQNKLFLVGMGGIGKSELFRQFLQKNRERFRMVIWLTFADSIEETIGDDHSLRIEGLSKDLYPEMSQKEYFERKLELLKNMCDENTCIVLDNFDVEEDENLPSLLDG